MAIANFSLATSESFKDRDGNKQERTEWHNVTLFGRPAEIAGEYLRKGGQAYIEGRLKTEKYTDKEGVEKTVTKIIGDRMQLIGRRGDSHGEDGSEGSGTPTGPSGSRGGGGAGNAAPAPMEDFDDEIPFITQADVLFQPRALLRRVQF
jgi:single-strand DNA-binding protein